MWCLFSWGTFILTWIVECSKLILQQILWSRILAVNHLWNRIFDSKVVHPRYWINGEIEGVELPNIELCHKRLQPNFTKPLLIQVCHNTMFMISILKKLCKWLHFRLDDATIVQHGNRKVFSKVYDETWWNLSPHVTCLLHRTTY